MKKTTSPRVNTIKVMSDARPRDLAEIMIARVLHAPGVRPESYWRRRRDDVPAYVDSIDTKRDRVIYRRSKDDEEDAKVLSRTVFLREYAPVPS